MPTLGYLYENCFKISCLCCFFVKFALWFAVSFQEMNTNNVLYWSLLIPCMGVMLLSCAKRRYQGQHSSAVKEAELKAKSDFDLKQAKVIVDGNEKNR